MTSLGSNLGEVKHNDRGYYWELPNGILIQFGKTKESHNNYDFKYFPKPYKNIYIGLASASEQTDGEAWINIIDITKFLIGVGSNINGSTYCYWITIGY